MPPTRGSRMLGDQIMSISGHATMKELVRYTAAADQARLAHAAMLRMSSAPAPASANRYEQA
jgi:hypothetical protein